MTTLKRNNTIVLIIGRKGSGKSTLARVMVPKLGNRIIILDPLHEYSGGVICHSFDQFRRSIKSLYDSYEIRYYSDPTNDNRPLDYSKIPFRYVLRFDNDSDYDKAVGLTRNLGHCWIVIEEITHFVSTYHKSENFDRIIRYARHTNVSVLMISQRCAEIPRLYTSQADSVISFKQSEPRDIEYLSKVGIVGKAGSEKVQTLPVFEYPKSKKDLIRVLDECSITFPDDSTD